MHQVQQLGIHLSLPDDLAKIAEQLGVFRLWQAMGLESKITLDEDTGIVDLRLEGPVECIIQIQHDLADAGLPGAITMWQLGAFGPLPYATA